MSTGNTTLSQPGNATAAGAKARIAVDLKERSYKSHSGFLLSQFFALVFRSRPFTDAPMAHFWRWTPFEDIPIFPMTRFFKLFTGVCGVLQDRFRETRPARCAPGPISCMRAFLFIFYLYCEYYANPTN
jgi:hypothetical protein